MKTFQAKSALLLAASVAFSFMTSTVFAANTVTKSDQPRQKIARSVDVTVTTNDSTLSCDAYFSDPEEAQALFINDDLVSFIKKNYKHNIIAQPQGTNANKPNTTGFGMTQDRLTQLANLQNNYIPVCINLVNSSDNPIYLQRNAYITEISSYIVDKQQILCLYPQFGPEMAKSQRNTKIFAGVGALLSAIGLAQYYELTHFAHVKKVFGLSTALIAGIPGALSLLNAARRYFMKECPLQDMMDQCAAFQANAVTVNVQSINNSSSANLGANQDVYVVPAQSIFTEMIFLDKNAVDANGGVPTSLTLAYSAATPSANTNAQAQDTVVTDSSSSTVAGQ